MNLKDAKEAHEGLLALLEMADEARVDRDAAIIKARQQGATAYRIAKELGLAESTIGRIINRSQQ